MEPAVTPSASAPVETALQSRASGLLSVDRSLLNLRRSCFLSSSYSAVLTRQPELVGSSGHSRKGQRSKSAAPSGGSGKRQGRRAVSGFHLLDSVRGAGNSHWIGIPGETHRAPRGMSLADAHRESRARSSWDGPAWVAVRRARLNPMRPVPGLGTGPASFLGRKHWQKPDHVFQYPAPGRH